MNNFAPDEHAESWDNVGLLVGDPEFKVNKILVSLDASPEVIEEAINKDVDLIITHHPLIFSKIDRITSDNIIGKLVLKLIKNDISLFTAHTNLDKAQGGVDDTLANLIGLKDIKQLSSKTIVEKDELNFGKIGRLDPKKTIEGLARQIGRAIGKEIVEIVLSEDSLLSKEISSVALCAGSGSDFIDEAIRMKADIFVTGEIKYHDALEAKWKGMDLMLLGHYHSERPIVAELITRLQKELYRLQYDIELLESEAQGSPFLPYEVY